MMLQTDRIGHASSYTHVTLTGCQPMMLQTDRIGHASYYTYVTLTGCQPMMLQTDRIGHASSYTHVTQVTGSDVASFQFYSKLHFLKLIARGFLLVLRFPPLLHRFNGSTNKIKLK